VRAGTDIELSHWVPNQTAAEFKADSSTEICLRYAASASRRDADLVVNDHADVDGFLALYALLESDTALEHFDTLVGAAEMGDFLAWAERPAFRLSQELSLLLLGADRPADVGDCYAEAMKIVTGVLDGSRPVAPAVTAGWEQLVPRCVGAFVLVGGDPRPLDAPRSRVDRRLQRLERRPRAVAPRRRRARPARDHERSLGRGRSADAVDDDVGPRLSGRAQLLGRRRRQTGAEQSRSRTGRRGVDAGLG
jgi:hypothetical protein